MKGRRNVQRRRGVTAERQSGKRKQAQGEGEARTHAVCAIALEGFRSTW